MHPSKRKPPNSLDKATTIVSNNFTKIWQLGALLGKLGLGNWRCRELEGFLRVQRFSVFAGDWIEVVRWSGVSEVIELRKEKQGNEGKGQCGEAGGCYCKLPSYLLWE